MTDFVPDLLGSLEKYQAERAQGRPDRLLEKAAGWLQIGAFLVTGIVLILVGLVLVLRKNRPGRME